jgi:hypothetical protein
MRSTVLVLLILLLAAASAAAQPSRFDVYGYFDLEARVDNGGGKGENLGFDQHHYNLILRFGISPRASVLGELEWEHGADMSGGAGLGHAYIARAWIEYTTTEVFGLRAGKFLLPFGIFNELHDATPTFVATNLPASIYGKHAVPGGKPDRLFPKFGAGLWGLGHVRADDWDLRYDVYVANGRGVSPYEADDNADKGVGARLVVTPLWRDVSFGASFYRERNGAAAGTRNLGVAAQLQLGSAGWHLAAEITRFNLEGASGTGAATDPWVPNGSRRHTLGYYVELGYRVRDLVMPFVRYDAFDPDTGAGGDHELDFVLGLNVSPVACLVLKGEAHFLRFDAAGRRDFEMGVASVAVAF